MDSNPRSLHNSECDCVAIRLYRKCLFAKSIGKKGYFPIARMFVSLLMTQVIRKLHKGKSQAPGSTPSSTLSNGELILPVSG